MSVDIRLNQMIDALDGRLKGVLLEDVELSVRTLKALKDCGASTLHDAQMALINRTLHKQKGIGPKAVKEVEEVIASVCLMMPAKSEHRRGTVYLSCGHEADTGCSGVDVTWEDEECVAGEGFLPATMFGVFCHECAQTFAYEEGKAAAVRTIEALTAENERLREENDRQDRDIGTLRLLALSIQTWREDADSYDRECGHEPRVYCEDVELMEQAAGYALRRVSERAALGDTQ